MKKGRKMSVNVIAFFPRRINSGQAMDLTCFTQTQLRSDTVAVFDKSATLDTGQIVSALCEKYRTVIAGARNRLNGRVF